VKYQDELKEIKKQIEAVHAGAASSARNKGMEDGYYIWKDLTEGYDKLLFSVGQLKKRADIARAVYLESTGFRLAVKKYD
jgi:hypothetical protein